MAGTASGSQSPANYAPPPCSPASGRGARRSGGTGPPRRCLWRATPPTPPRSSSGAATCCPSGCARSAAGPRFPRVPDTGGPTGQMSGAGIRPPVDPNFGDEAGAADHADPRPLHPVVQGSLPGAGRNGGAGRQTGFDCGAFLRAVVHTPGDLGSGLAELFLQRLELLPVAFQQQAMMFADLARQGLAQLPNLGPLLPFRPLRQRHRVRLAVHQRLEHPAARCAQHIAGHAGQLDVGILEHLLHPMADRPLPLRQPRPASRQVPQIADRARRPEAVAQQPMHQPTLPHLQHARHHAVFVHVQSRAPPIQYPQVVSFRAGPRRTWAFADSPSHAYRPPGGER
jgi:hypothetical protein